MKKIYLILFIMAGMLIYACQENKPTDDPEKLKAIVTGYFDGLKMKDFEKMKDLTTNDFLLFENGKVFNNDSLIKKISSYSKFIADYEFDNFTINIDKNTGNLRYFNHGEFIINDTIHRAVNWLESATFKKVDNTWKMEFLHSTVRK
jgi:hypothetical protein